MDEGAADALRMLGMLLVWWWLIMRPMPPPPKL